MAMLLAAMVWSEGVAGYQPHDPILIIGDAQFTPENGVTAGRGTQEEPYTIEGWEIDLSSLYAANASRAVGIQVWNTTAHFVVRGVYVHDAWVGVYLWNVTNARLEGSLISSSDTGVRVQGATRYDPYLGFRVWRYADAAVVRNDLSDLKYESIMVSYARGALIESNSLSDSTWAYGGGRITVAHSQQVTVRGNGVDTAREGIVFTEVEDSFVLENSVRTLATYYRYPVIWLQRSSGNRVMHNNLYGSQDSFPSAIDDPQNLSASSNAWDDGYPSGGNFWSGYPASDRCGGAFQDRCDDGPDGLGDEPVSVAVDTSSVCPARCDRYPLMTPFARPLTPDTSGTDALPLAAAGVGIAMVAGAAYVLWRWRGRQGRPSA